MAHRSRNKIEPLRIADASSGLSHVFIRDLELEARVGIYPHEKSGSQRIRINLDLGVEDDTPAGSDRLADVVDYETIVNRVKGVVDDGHVNLVETLAERLARICLVDPRVVSVRVRVEKLDAIAEAASVGVEIERFRGPG